MMKITSIIESILVVSTLQPDDQDDIEFKSDGPDRPNRPISPDVPRKKRCTSNARDTQLPPETNTSEEPLNPENPRDHRVLVRRVFSRCFTTTKRKHFGEILVEASDEE